jgi:hypothetical protein
MYWNLALPIPSPELIVSLTINIPKEGPIVTPATTGAFSGSETFGS